MNYNLTLFQEAVTVTGMVEVVNNYAGGFLIGMFLIIIFFVLMMMFKRWEFDKSLLVASWLCFMFSLFLKSAGLINFYFVLVFLILSSLTALYLYVKKK